MLFNSVAKHCEIKIPERKISMENTKKNYSMKSKLISAIAMLLVATIMLVSSTYAWFTLSTKPEVSGISTAVGANGALEMLLATKKDGAWVYGTGEVAGKTVAERNTHWGNLVDLSDKDTVYYGSGAITLYPAILEITDTGEINPTAPIRTPVYGVDGRVEETKTGGMFGLYDTGKSVFVEKAGNYGFRAIGIASGLTARQQAFRVAVSQIMVNSASAQAKARTALSENGNALASIAIKKAMVDGATYDSTNTNAVQSMITGVKGALAKIEDAYLEIIYASILGKGSGLEDDAATLAANAAKDAAANETSGVLGAKVTAALAGTGIDKSALESYDKFEAAVAKVTEAQTKFDAIAEKLDENGNCTWDDLSPALYPLVDVENITINGHIPTEVKKHTDEIVQDVIGGKGINVVISTGGGVFADIADYSGDYTVGIVIDTNELNLGVSAGKVDATMKADSTLTKNYLTAAKDAVNAQAPDSGEASANPLTEFYGYAIDLAFKTNASTSNLLLQTAPADRIYGDNQNEETMGKGSTMTFSTTDTTFNQEKMLGLMGKLKVVFYDTDTNKILANAKLDTNPDNVTGSATDGLTANLYIEGKDADGNPTLLKDAGKGEIVALSPGLEQHVTVLVYLDGENISNADVSAIAEDAKSMSGTFNIQFASSAKLQPMEYSDLHTAAPAANNP